MKVNVFSENIYEHWQINEKKFINAAKKIIKYYLSKSDIYEKSCFNGLDFKTITFDFLYCGSEKTHQINREYRNKDYPADIITFAIFADAPDEERFIFDGEINLGEIMIALDKVIDEAGKKGIKPEDELSFLISHGILHLLGFEHETTEDYNFIVRLQNEALKAVRL